MTYWSIKKPRINIDTGFVFGYKNILIDKDN